MFLNLRDSSSSGRLSQTKRREVRLGERLPRQGEARPGRAGRSDRSDRPDRPGPHRTILTLAGAFLMLTLFIYALSLQPMGRMLQRRKTRIYAALAEEKE